MTAFSSTKPGVLEKHYGDRYLYHYNIEEVEVQSEEEGGATTTQYQYEEVAVYGPITRDKLLKAVINDKWDKDYEQKLINEYNAYKLKVSTDKEAQTNYTEFLNERQALKEQVYADWEAQDLVK